MPGHNKNNGKLNKDSKRPAEEKNKTSPKVPHSVNGEHNPQSMNKANKLKKKFRKEVVNDKKEKKIKKDVGEVKKSLTKKVPQNEKEKVEKAVEIPKPISPITSEVISLVPVPSKSPTDKQPPKMEEESLDDDENYPYYHKHPVLYGIFIPDNTSREIIYITKKLYTIARRRNADYIIQDRRISNDGIKVSVNIEYDQAEFSTRRFSAASVYVNDNIRLEYNWMPLFNGDTLTFADGSRYTFYNIYNHRDIDEITVDDSSIIRYVRRNTMDDTEKIVGAVSILMKDTNFDKIEHKKIPAEEEEFDEYEEDDMNLPDSPELLDPPLLPSFLSKSAPKELNAPEPLSELTPEVNDDDANGKDLDTISKEIFDKIASLNTVITENMKNRDKEEIVHHVKSSDGNIFEDGDGVTKTVKRDKPEIIMHPLLDERSRNRGINFSFPTMMYLSGPPHRIREKKPETVISLYDSPVVPQKDGQDEHTFILYRSKQKMMIASQTVYDIIIDAYFKEMMEGIDMEDIRSVLSQNNKNQNSNYKTLFKETLLKDIITPEKNTTTFENCGYHVTESFQKYSSLLFQSYIQNEKYHEVKEGVDVYSYIPQFVRMTCDNGKRFMTNLIYSIANIHKADILLFNFEKNLLIEGTPLCYRKYLFGLFPSAIHIKPAVHSIPKKKKKPSSSESGSDLFMDDPYITMVDENGGFDDDEINLSEDEGLDDISDEEFLNDGVVNVDPISEGDKLDSKEEDDIMEGDIVVVSPLESDSLLSSRKKPIVLRYPHSIALPPLPEPTKYKEKERRAVVVKLLGKDRLIIRYLDKEEPEERSTQLRTRYSVDFSDSLVNATSEREIKKRCKNQLLARSLHSCQRSRVRKWVDEDDQKFLLMKCVNEILSERHEKCKQTKDRSPFFIVFEDAPLLIRRRNANILSLLHIHDRTFSFPVFVILTEKNRYHPPQPQNDMMMIGGLNMNVIMGGSLRPKTENRSHIEQYFDSVMEKSFTLPYPGTDITTQTDIMILDVPTPQDTKFKYSFDKKVEEDEKAALRVKHLKELSFFLRAHHLYCLDLQHIRYLDLKRIKSWIPVIRMAYSLQASQGITYMKESEIFDVYSKNHDSIVRTGKPVYVSENPSDTVYGLLDRKNIEYAIKVNYNTEKESHPDSVQEIRCKNESEKRLIHNGSFISPNNITVGFDDVGSLENVKAKLRETIILPLRRPEIFAQSSLLKSCKGLLLFGPPGTGKTMLAKALARESGANFLSIATSTIFNKYVGDSEQNTRAIFTLAARLSPCVIFIDEIDSLLSSRDQNGSGQEYSRKVKNEFMSSWDGLMTDDNLRVVVIGCTNRPFDLDDAVLRRFSRKLLVDLPDSEQREKILKVILRKEKLSSDVDLKAIASDTMTKGFSGSDLYNLCQTAAYMPIREIVAKEETNTSLTSQPKMDSMGLLSLEEEDDNMDVEEEEIKVRPLTMKDFEAASKEITFSFEESNAAIRAIREWNEKYGDNGSRKSDDLSYYI